jgi:DNA-directed RNA polymerase specialized sigma24 family protein
MKEQRNAPTDREGYDLFRRAIVEQDSDAWHACVIRYRPLLIAWATSKIASAELDESNEDIADQALVRAWSALSPDRFAGFPSLAALLAYLRTCVGAVVIDHIRARNTRQHIQQRLGAGFADTPEQLILAEIDRKQLWRSVYGLAKTNQERTILVERFMLDLPARTIYARHPNLFAEVATVYSTQRNLIARLQRSPELQQLYQEVISQ